MNLIIRNLSYALFFLIPFFSCKDSHEKSIDPAFSNYLNRFLDSASLRGIYYNLDETGLIMEFGNLKSNIAGLTHYEKPVRIEFDRNYWEAIERSAASDLMKEELVFHELGHALLRRKHLNSVLENNDWKSIMCGGTNVDDRPWNINYKGIRREYYIDELFKENTPSPPFASSKLPVDTNGYIPRKIMTFDSSSSSGWSIGETPERKTSIVNGQLQCVSKIKNTLFVFITMGISVLSDFSFDLDIQNNTPDQSSFAGMAFGSISDSNKPFSDQLEYFYINSYKKMHIGNSSWYSFYTELNEYNIIKKQGINHLKIFKLGNILYYFINGTYVYHNEIEVYRDGFIFGFSVPPYGNVSIDNLILKQSLTFIKTETKTNFQNTEKQLFAFKIIKNLNQVLCH